MRTYMTVAAQAAMAIAADDATPATCSAQSSRPQRQHAVVAPQQQPQRRQHHKQRRRPWMRACVWRCLVRVHTCLFMLVHLYYLHQILYPLYECVPTVAPRTHVEAAQQAHKWLSCTRLTLRDMLPHVVHSELLFRWRRAATSREAVLELWSRPASALLVLGAAYIAIDAAMLVWRLAWYSVYACVCIVCAVASLLTWLWCRCVRRRSSDRDHDKCIAGMPHNSNNNSSSNKASLSSSTATVAAATTATTAAWRRRVRANTAAWQRRHLPVSLLLLLTHGNGYDRVVRLCLTLVELAWYAQHALSVVVVRIRRVGAAAAAAAVAATHAVKASGGGGGHVMLAASTPAAGAAAAAGGRSSGGGSAAVSAATSMTSAGTRLLASAASTMLGGGGGKSSRGGSGNALLRRQCAAFFSLAQVSLEPLRALPLLLPLPPSFPSLSVELTTDGVMALIVLVLCIAVLLDARRVFDALVGARPLSVPNGHDRCPLCCALWPSGRPPRRTRRKSASCEDDKEDDGDDDDDNDCDAVHTCPRLWAIDACRHDDNKSTSSSAAVATTTTATTRQSWRCVSRLPRPGDAFVHPDEVSWWSAVTFSWVNALMSVASFARYGDFAVFQRSESGGTKDKSNNSNNSNNNSSSSSGSNRLQPVLAHSRRRRDGDGATRWTALAEAAARLPPLPRQLHTRTCIATPALLLWRRECARAAEAAASEDGDTDDDMSDEERCTLAQLTRRGVLERAVMRVTAPVRRLLVRAFRLFFLPAQQTHHDNNDSSSSSQSDAAAQLPGARLFRLFLAHPSGRAFVWVCGPLKFAQDGLSLCSPFAVRALVMFIRDVNLRSAAEARAMLPRGLLLSACLSLAVLAQSVAFQLYVQQLHLAALKATSALKSLLLHHTLHTTVAAARTTTTATATTTAAAATRHNNSNNNNSNNSSSSTATAARAASAAPSPLSQEGEVVSLLSSDAAACYDCLVCLHNAWGHPMLVLVSLATMYRYVGTLPTLSTLLAVAVLTPLNRYFATRVRVAQQGACGNRQRISDLTTALSSMRTVKAMALERSLVRRVEAARAHESAGMTRVAVAESASVVQTEVMMLVIALVCCGTHLLTGGTMDAAVLVPTMAALQVMRFPLWTFPHLFSQVSRSYAALCRIEGYLETGHGSTHGSGSRGSDTNNNNNNDKKSKGDMHSSSPASSSTSSAAVWPPAQLPRGTVYCDGCGFAWCNDAAAAGVRSGAHGHTTTTAAPHSGKDSGSSSHRACMSPLLLLPGRTAAAALMAQSGRLYQPPPSLSASQVSLDAAWSASAAATTTTTTTAAAAMSTSADEVTLSADKLLLTSCTTREQQAQQQQQQQQHALRLSVPSSPSMDMAPQTTASPLSFTSCANERADAAASHAARALVLPHVRLHIRPGEFVLVRGPTASGKTALLLAVLGELHARRATAPQPASSAARQLHLAPFAPSSSSSCVSVVDDKGGDDASAVAAAAARAGFVTSGRVAYCAESPWLRDRSVRDNICMCGSRDSDDDDDDDNGGSSGGGARSSSSSLALGQQAWYETVLHACALSDDLAALPHGDATIVGEDGAKLSGGQRARVAIARALYALPHTDILLFDDVLSALDVEAQRHIVAHVFCGLLRQRHARADADGRPRATRPTVIFATHVSADVLRPDRVLELHGSGNVREVCVPPRQAPCNDDNDDNDDGAEDDEVQHKGDDDDGAVTRATRCAVCARMALHSRTSSKSSDCGSGDDGGGGGDKAGATAPVTASMPVTSTTTATMTRAGRRRRRRSAMRAAARASTTAKTPPQSQPQPQVHTRRTATATAAVTRFSLFPRRDDLMTLFVRYMGPGHLLVVLLASMIMQAARTLLDNWLGIWLSLHAVEAEKELLKSKPVQRLHSTVQAVLHVAMYVRGLSTSLPFAHTTGAAAAPPPPPPVVVVHPRGALARLKHFIVSEEEAQIARRFLVTYACVGLLFALSSYAHSRVFHASYRRVCDALQLRVVRRLFAAPVSYYDRVASSTLLQVLSRDQHVVDSLLGQSIELVLLTVLQLTASIGFNALRYRAFALVLPVSVFVFHELTRRYLVLIKQLRTVESRLQAYVVSLSKECYRGGVTLRAYGAPLLHRVEAEVDATLDALHTVAHACIAAERWVALRLELVSVIMTSALSVLAVCTACLRTRATAARYRTAALERDAASAGAVFAGLGIVASIAATRSLSLLCRRVGMFQSEFVSAEQLLNLLREVPQEDGVRQHAPSRSNVDVDVDGDTAVTTATAAATAPTTMTAEAMAPLTAPVTTRTRTLLLDVRRLCAKYQPSMPYVLRNVSFQLYAGECVGLIGHTGNGKSSVFNALLRLMDVVEGGMYVAASGLPTKTPSCTQQQQQQTTTTTQASDGDVDGDNEEGGGSGSSNDNSDVDRNAAVATAARMVDAFAYDATLLRRRFFHVVTQEPFLVQGTCRSNLLLGLDAATAARIDDAQMLDALHKTGADELLLLSAHSPSTTTAASAQDVTSMAASTTAAVAGGAALLDAVVMAGGTNLSAGQRQLLCLARALLHRPRVVLLDEVSSRVDARTEVAIQDVIRSELLQRVPRCHVRRASTRNVNDTESNDAHTMQSSSSCGVLLIAHRLETIMALCDRVLVIERGRCVACLTKEQVHSLHDLKSYL